MLLALVVAANLALPLLYVGSGDEPADTRAAQTPPAAEERHAPAAEPPPTMPVQPVEVPLIARRSLPPEPTGAGRSAPPPPEPELVCRAFGPFSDRAAAEALAERLAAQLALPDAALRIVETETRTAAEYLVTVQGADSRRAAAGLMEALAQQNVETHLLDRPGAVLAAGVFSSEARAEAQRRRLAELGYEAAVETFTRSARGYHLLARIAADRQIDAPAAGACGDIAPPGQFL